MLRIVGWYSMYFAAKPISNIGPLLFSAAAKSAPNGLGMRG